MKAKKLHIDEWHVCIISFIRSVLALTLALVLMVLALSRSLIHVNYFVTVTWTSLRSTVKLSYTEEKLWNGLDEAAASSSVVFFRRICLYLTATRNSRGGSSYQLARATEQPTNSTTSRTHQHTRNSIGKTKLEPQVRMWLHTSNGRGNFQLSAISKQDKSHELSTFCYRDTMFKLKHTCTSPELCTYPPSVFHVWFLSTIAVLPWLSILYFDIYVCYMFNKITYLITVWIALASISGVRRPQSRHRKPP